LGAVLYVLLARRPLYNARSFIEMLQKQRLEKPAPLRSVAADVPVEFEQIIHRLLEKDPERRFATANVVQRRLESMLESLSLMPPAAPGHVTVDPAPVGMSTGSDPPPVNPLAVTVEATHFLPPMDPPERADAPVASPDDPPKAEPEHAPAASETPVEPSPAESVLVSATAPGSFVAVRPGELDQSLPERREMPWISPQTWALVIGLLAVGLLVWYMLQPLSADALYRRIEQQTSDGSPEGVEQAEKDINQFLMRFPADARCGQLNKDLERLETWHLERDLRMNRKNALTPVERFYMDALNAAKVDVDQGLEKFRAMVDLFEPRRDISAAELRCIQLAKRRIEELDKQSEQQHKEMLIAVNRSLDRADELAKSEPERAAKIRNAVIKLYSGKAWADEALQRARAASDKR
jgi:hypothetical protein